MSASASVTIPVAAGSALRAADARRVVAATAGASGASFDAGAGTLTMHFSFPGNIDGLVRRLRSVHVGVGPTATISVPVKNLSGRLLDPAKLLADLNESPAVSHASFDGTTVTATVATATNAFRYVYEELIINGLMPLDVPAVAHAWEFVL